MNDLFIRRASIDDARLIADMSRESFYDTFAADNRSPDMEMFMNGPFSTENLMKQVSEQERIFFIAYTGSQPVGYACLHDEGNNEKIDGLPAIEIARIYAMKSAIGKGVGKALLQQCLQTAVALGKSVVWLGVWEKNQRAISFYRKFGFEKFGEHPFILGTDRQTDWKMKKKLVTEGGLKT